MTYEEFKSQYPVRLNRQQEEAVRQTEGFFSQLGWALFGVSVVVCCFEFGLEYSTGRGNIQQTALNILKGFLAVSLFSTVPITSDFVLCVDTQAQIG